ncbi:unknown [Eubacterium sp. CAG:252]|jgi:predicted ATP-binding protein involved in virulence|nr:unknown [Eubacterium sp. CAG:252]
MRLRELKLDDFKAIESADINFDGKSTIIFRN